MRSGAGYCLKLVVSLADTDVLLQLGGGLVGGRPLQGAGGCGWACRARGGGVVARRVDVDRASRSGSVAGLLVAVERAQRACAPPAAVQVGLACGAFWQRACNSRGMAPADRSKLPRGDLNRNKYSWEVSHPGASRQRRDRPPRRKSFVPFSRDRRRGRLGGRSPAAYRCSML